MSEVAKQLIATYQSIEAAFWSLAAFILRHTTTHRCINTTCQSKTRHFILYTIKIVQDAAEIVKHFKILVTCLSARVSRSAGIFT